MKYIPTLLKEFAGVWIFTVSSPISCNVKPVLSRGMLSMVMETVNNGSFSPNLFVWSSAVIIIVLFDAEKKYSVSDKPPSSPLGVTDGV